MHQWQYCSLRITGEGLRGYNHETDRFIYVDIPPDILVDNGNTAITLRRWAAALGQHGWELVNILTDELGQEWVFKRPYP